MTIFFDDNALAQGAKQAEAATRIRKENKKWGKRMTIIQDCRWLSLADRIILTKAFGSLQGRRDPGRRPRIDQSFSKNFTKFRGRHEWDHGARSGGGQCAPSSKCEFTY